MHKIILFLIPIFILALMIPSVQDAQALSIQDYDSCKQRYETLKLIGIPTYIMHFGNSEADRFCMSLFEAGLVPKEVKGQYQIPKLGLEVDLPKNWSGSEIHAENMTLAFIFPDKRESDTMQHLWNMIIIIDNPDGKDISEKVFTQIGESLNDVPHFRNTCTVKESTFVEIPDTILSSFPTLKEDTAVCIDRKLSLFVTITSYSFTAKEHEVFIISAFRHLPSHSPDNILIGTLQKLELKKILENIDDVDTSVSEIKKDKTPTWFKKYIALWGEGKITDRQIISLFNYIVKNNNLNISFGSDYGHYNAAKVPDWFRNTAFWLDKGLISDEEFLNNFKYLVKNRIIVL